MAGCSSGSLSKEQYPTETERDALYCSSSIVQNACTLTAASCMSNVVCQGKQRLHMTGVSDSMYDGVCDGGQSTYQELSFLRVPQVDLAVQSSRCQQLAIWPVS